MLTRALLALCLLLMPSAKVTTAEESQPEVTFYALPSAIVPYGQSVELEWQVIGATEVWVETGTGWAKVDPVGKRWVTPKSSCEYALVAWNDSSVVMYELWVLVEAK